jgi:hypothetical protein
LTDLYIKSLSRTTIFLISFYRDYGDESLNRLRREIVQIDPKFDKEEFDWCPVIISKR